MTLFPAYAIAQEHYYYKEPPIESSSNNISAQNSKYINSQKYPQPVISKKSVPNTNISSSVSQYSYNIKPLSPKKVMRLVKQKNNVVSAIDQNKTIVTPVAYVFHQPEYQQISNDEAHIINRNIFTPSEEENKNNVNKASDFDIAF